MALKLDVLANTRQFVMEMKKAGASAEDITDALDELARQGDKDLEKVEGSLKEVAKASKKTGDAIGKDMKGGFDEAKSEAASSGREAAASFSGGFEDVADFAQETLANALGGFGPAGAAAGTALALGLGAALSSMSAEQERIEAVRDAAKDLASELYQNRGVLPIQGQIDKAFDFLISERPAQGIESWLNEFVDLGSNLDEVKKAAKNAGTSVTGLMKALAAGNPDETTRQIRILTAALEKTEDIAKRGGTDLFANAATAQNIQGLLKQLQSVDDMNAIIAESTKEVDAAFGDAAASEAAASAAAEAHASKVAELSSVWQDAAVDAANYWITSKEGATSFDWSTYLADAEYASAQADEFKRKIVTLPPDIAAEGERVFAAQGAEAANAYIKAYESADAANKTRFVNVAKANGEAAGTAAAQGMVSKFGAPVLTSTVKVNVDDKAWRDWQPVMKNGRIEAYVMGTGRQVI
jgi:hypothetical protein